MNTNLEDILHNSYKKGMVAYVKNNPEVIGELMKLSITNKKPFSLRAALILSDCIEENDERLIAFIPSILEALPACSDGQQRDLFRVLKKMELTDDQEGQVFEMAIDIWCQLAKQPGTRYLAYMMLIDIANKYPELLHEIILLSTDEYFEKLSPGIKRVLLRIRNELQMHYTKKG